MATTADHELAARVATEAGRLLVELRSKLAAEGTTGKALGAEGDQQAHVLIMRMIGDGAPGDAILSEEGKADPARLNATRAWIVDPLDGTREFGEDPRTDWAVHIALVEDGRPAAGAVALPARNMTLSTAQPPPRPTAAAPNGRTRIVVSRSRPPAEATTIAEALGGDLVELGSAGAKAMAVVLGDAEVYAHAGGQYEWDSCAPVAVALAAGLHATRLDGSPLIYNQPDPYLPDLLICRPELAGAVIAAIR